MNLEMKTKWSSVIETLQPLGMMLAHFCFLQTTFDVKVAASLGQTLLRVPHFEALDFEVAIEYI